MRELAHQVHVLQGLPRYAVNCYLVGDVLVDAGTRLDGPFLLRQLRGRPLAAHALTHAHPDHNGASAAVCSARGVPYWVGARDAAAANDGTIVRTSFPSLPLGALWDRTWARPPVERELREGDELAGFTVLDTPGHTRGHIALWREQDRTLIAGDVLLGVAARCAPSRTGTSRPATSTRPRTSARCGGWSSCAPSWCASGTGRRCATRHRDWRRCSDGPATRGRRHRRRLLRHRRRHRGQSARASRTS